MPLRCVRPALLLALACGCRGSGVPWRTAEFTLTSGASASLEGKAGAFGVSLTVKVETEDDPASRASILLDRGLPTERAIEAPAVSSEGPR